MRSFSTTMCDPEVSSPDTDVQGLSPTVADLSRVAARATLLQPKVMCCDLQGYDDLFGKPFAAANREGVGGWSPHASGAALTTGYTRGISPPHHLRELALPAVTGERNLPAGRLRFFLFAVFRRHAKVGGATLALAVLSLPGRPSCKLSRVW